MMPIMRWPYNKRADPTYAWGTIGTAVAIAAIIVTALVTLHANNSHFRWWWPTDWMAIPAAILIVGLILLVLPIQRSPAVPGTISGRLPLVKEANDLDARVHRAVLPIPYIHRDAEDEAQDYLEAGRPVLLVGSSMVGKTQMAVTLIRAMFANRRIAIPDSMNALAVLDAADVTMRGSVIFLDDIDRMIGARGITDGDLRRLAAAGNAVVGTIRAAQYYQYQPTDQLRPLEWDVLSVFERVFISRALSETEADRVTTTVSDHDIRERIIRTGLGEYVGAAEHIEEALKLGPSVSPTGYALVQGVADWRRGGMSTPLPATLLPTLAAPHLAARELANLADKETYEAALQWATRDITPTAALLQRTEPGRFAIYDYALDILSRLADPIPEATWPVLIQNASPSDLVGIGYTAHVSFHQPLVAEQAWRKAADSGDSKAIPLAAVNLGVLLREQGHVEDARAAFQRAIDSGHADAGSMAAINLGTLLLREKGDVDGARAAYQRAIDSGHAQYAPEAAVNLGTLLLREKGDVDGARAAYQRAIDSGHADAAPKAAVNLSTLLREHEDANGVQGAYQRTIGTGLTCQRCYTSLYTCPGCHGHGIVQHIFGECTECNGTGFICPDDGKYWQR